MPMYVIGHVNPDTDAICSVLGYADLLRGTAMPEGEAERCGELNARTTFALGKDRQAASVEWEGGVSCKKQPLPHFISLRRGLLWS